MVAHKPSIYAAFTGRNASSFVTLENNIRQLLLVRSHYSHAVPFIEVGMVVDISNVYQIPDMIRYAESLGVDGIRFQNFISPNQHEKSLHTIYSNYKKAKQFLASLSEKDYGIQVILPPVLDQDMSKHRNCKDPHTMVSITGDMHVSPCSRHALHKELTDNVWDDAFWNSTTYQRLRLLHGKSTDTVPLPCQNCPKNVAQSPRILNDRNAVEEPVTPLHQKTAML